MSICRFDMLIPINILVSIASITKITHNIVFFATVLVFDFFGQLNGVPRSLGGRRMKARRSKYWNEV